MRQRGGGDVGDISDDKPRPAPVRLTSLTSNGTVCSGFGARKVRQRFNRLKKTKQFFLFYEAPTGISEKKPTPPGISER